MISLARYDCYSKEPLVTSGSIWTPCSGRKQKGLLGIWTLDRYYSIFHFEKLPVFLQWDSHCKALHLWCLNAQGEDVPLPWSTAVPWHSTRAAQRADRAACPLGSGELPPQEGPNPSRKCLILGLLWNSWAWSWGAHCRAWGGGHRIWTCDCAFTSVGAQGLMTRIVIPNL